MVDLCAAREAPLVGLTPMPPHEKPDWLSGILLAVLDLSAKDRGGPVADNQGTQDLTIGESAEGEKRGRKSLRWCTD